MITYIKYMIFISSYTIIHVIFSIFNIPYSSLYSSIINLLYWIIVVLYLKKKDCLTNHGLNIPSFSFNYSYLLLFIIPLFQLIINGFDNLTIIEIISLILSVLAEEFAFRVVLTKFLINEFNFSYKSSIIISSLVFAAFHIINPNKELTFSLIILQLVFAFCSGCALCILTKKTNSILPSIVLHFLINITSTGHTRDSIQIISIICMSIIFIVYSIINLQNKRIITHETIY